MQKIVCLKKQKNIVTGARAFLFYYTNNKLLKQKIKTKIKIFIKFSVIFIKLDGVGFKIMQMKKNLTFFFYFGLSHWVSISYQGFFIKAVLNNDKNIIKFYSINHKVISEFCFFLQKFKIPSIYKKKGAFLFDQNFFKKKIQKIKQIKKK